MHNFIIPNNRIETVMGTSLEYLNSLIANDSIENCPLSNVQFKTERVQSEVETENVLGMIKGKTDTSIVISAHYDHLGIRDGLLFAGADDNASGTSAMLELAEAFSTTSDLKYNIIFLATSAEEQGMLGSKYFVNTKEFDSNNIILNINIDMISRNDENHEKSEAYLYCIGAGAFPNLIPVIEKADQAYNKCSFDYSIDKPVKNSVAYRLSDQIRFYELQREHYARRDLHQCFSMKIG